MAIIARKVSEGLTTDYTPGAAVAAGEVVVLEDMIGVARVDIPANTQGALYLGGAHTLPKATGTAEVMPIGTDVYLDVSGEVVTVSASGNLYLGKVVHEAAGASDAEVTVLLIQAEQ